MNSDTQSDTDTDMFQEDYALLTKLENAQVESKQTQQIRHLQAEVGRLTRRIEKQNELLARYRAMCRKQLPQSSPSSNEEPASAKRRRADRDEPRSAPSMSVSQQQQQQQRIISAKARRVAQLEKCYRIRLPDNNRDPTEFLVEWEHIWQTILRAFEEIPGGILTENDIIKRGGKGLITPEVLYRFFVHEFTESRGDQWIEVRPMDCNARPNFLVILPDWLRVQIQVKIRSQETPEGAASAANPVAR